MPLCVQTVATNSVDTCSQNGQHSPDLVTWYSGRQSSTGQVVFKQTEVSLWHVQTVQASSLTFLSSFDWKYSPLIKQPPKILMEGIF